MPRGALFHPMVINYSALRARLSEGQRARLKSLAALAVDGIPAPWSLEMIGWRFATDKATHGYLEHYARHFEPFRRRPINVLEIGIGTYGPQGGGGIAAHVAALLHPGANPWAGHRRQTQAC